MQRFYGGALDSLLPTSGECAPTDRGCLNREWFLQQQHRPRDPCEKARCLLPGWKRPDSSQEEREEREALISTAGITDQWWFFPAVVAGAWLLFRKKG